MKTKELALYALAYLAVLLTFAAFCLTSCQSNYYTVKTTTVVKYNLKDSITGFRMKGRQSQTLFQDKLKASVDTTNTATTGF